MTALIWSVLAGGAGLLATWIAMSRLAQRPSEVQPVVSWVLGLAGLAPAWLIALVGLLGASPLERRPEQSLPILAWLVSSAAALLGLLLSDTAFRRLRDSAAITGPGRTGSWASWPSSRPGRSLSWGWPPRP